MVFSRVEVRGEGRRREGDVNMVREEGVQWREGGKCGGLRL